MISERGAPVWGGSLCLGVRVAHFVGPVAVPPGQTVRTVVQPSLAGSFFCTVHPSGTLAFEVQPRGLDLRLTVLPTVLIGIPLGLGLLVLAGALRRLGAAGSDLAERGPGTAYE
jgi:hypothetical protein